MHFYLGSLNIDSRLNFPIELSPAVLRELVGQKQSVFLNCSVFWIKVTFCICLHLDEVSRKSYNKSRITEQTVFNFNVFL